MHAGHVCVVVAPAPHLIVADFESHREFVSTKLDRGLTWTREQCTNGQDLESLHMLPDGHGWAAGTIIRSE